MSAVPKRPIPVKRLQLEILPELHRSIKIACATEGISLAAFTREAVNDRLAKSRKAQRRQTA